MNVQELRQRVLELHLQGLSRSQIAERLGIKTDRVSYHKEKLGIQRSESKITPRMKSIIHDLNRQGCSFNEIGRQVGLASSTVSRFLRSADHSTTAVEQMLRNPKNQLLAQAWIKGAGMKSVAAAMGCYVGETDAG